MSTNSTDTDHTNDAFLCPISVQFIGDASAVYGEEGLKPSTPLSAGIDLRACISKDITIAQGERHGIECGIAIEPHREGVAGFVYSRSGLGAVKGLVVAQGVGVIDPDYRGEIKVFLLNTGTEPQTVKRGDRIAQIVFQPYLYAKCTPCSNLGSTSRGKGGFGHTGV